MSVLCYLKLYLKYEENAQYVRYVQNEECALNAQFAQITQYVQNSN